MNVSCFQELYDYNFWADRRVWECVMQLTDEQFERDLGVPLGSIRMQCFHVMAVESWWFRFLNQGDLVFLDLEDYPSRATIRSAWDEVERAVRGYLAALTPTELEREVRPPFWEEGQPIKVWQALVQVANHSTDHRAQMLTGILQLGGPTIEQDYLGYLFAKQQGKASSC